MNRSNKLFWTLVAAQTLFLLVWAGYHEYVRQHAPVLLLKGRPVDPQDLLRGDFMIMNYDISTVSLPADPARSEKQGASGTDVWVLLERKDRYYEVAQAAREKLRPKPGQVLVRGSTGYNWRGDNASGRVDYGIERYFVPEGKGSPRFKLMEIEVSVSPAHRLYIKKVLLDGNAFP